MDGESAGAAAFKAGGFNDVEAAVYVRALRQRIRQLKTIDNMSLLRVAETEK